MRLSWMVLTLATAAAGCMPARAVTDSHQKEAAEGHDKDDEHLDDPIVIAAARSVRVLPGPASCASEVLGLVDVHEPVKTTEEGLELLKRRAAILGADTVTGVEFEHGEEASGRTHLSGTAVRCHDLLRGRSYDVIGKIVVTAEMEKEDEALASLKRQARAKGANLILNVKFEHGDSDRTTIEGLAVRAHD